MGGGERASGPRAEAIARLQREAAPATPSLANARRGPVVVHSERHRRRPDAAGSVFCAPRPRPRCPATRAVTAAEGDIARLRGVIGALCDTLDEVHDQHVYERTDDHPADCGYCSQVKAARAVIGAVPGFPAAKLPTLAIVVEGGVVQGVVSDDPDRGVAALQTVLVIDYDTDGGDDLRGSGRTTGPGRRRT